MEELCEYMLIQISVMVATPPLQLNYSINVQFDQTDQICKQKNSQNFSYNHFSLV